MQQNYIEHVNEWWWGKSITLIRKDCYATVELQFDDSYPSVAFVKGLSVYYKKRRCGLGTELLNVCHEVARKKGYSFLQLSANKEQDWLVEWYKRFGFEVFAIDEHEYTMIKAI